MNGLEFCGVIRTPSGVRYGLYDPSKQAGIWLVMGETVSGIVARSYDDARHVLTVEIQGQSQSLALKEPKFDSSVVMANRPPGPQVMPMIAPPSSNDEAARLQAVADEVKRRRALRQAAALGQVPNPQIQAVPPPAQR